MSRERPILFNAPMVRATLDDRKTLTRRVVKQKHLPWLANILGNFLDGKWNQRPLPYGQPGDRLWVRETWARDSEDGALCYRADIGTGTVADDWQRNIDDGAHGYRWRPSIHMPRWASRITLEVVSVRVERLQDISEADAIAEGTQEPSLVPITGARLSERAVYAALWESINGPGSWDANPWVWVVEFKRVTPP